MSIKHLFPLLLATSCLAVTPSQADVIVSLDLANSHVSTNLSNISGDAQLQASLLFEQDQQISLTASPGQNQWQFDFLRLDASETRNGGAEFEIQTQLAFNSPAIVQSNLASGKFYTFAGVISTGRLNWESASEIIELDDGSIFELSLEQGSNTGFFSSIDIQATLTLLQEANPVTVPEPSGLFGLALLGLFHHRLKHRA